MIILQAMFSRGLGGLERAFLDHAAMLAARGHGFPAHRIRQVPNALPSRCAALPRREGDALRAPLVVGVLGRMVHKKGFDVFLKGFRMALDSGLQARALIGGDGPERAGLEALCRDLGLSSSVRFVGWVSDPAEFYEQIDICCVPSRDEPFGIVVLEGFAHGTPVLAAATGGPRELIQDGVTGGLFEPDNPRSLAAALSRIAQEQTLRAMRGAAYATVQDYRCAAVGQRLEEALRSAVESASKRPG